MNLGQQKGLGSFEPRPSYWLRGEDLNLRPSGYEPDEAAPPRGNSVETDCSVEDLNITDYFFVCQEFGKNIF